MQIRSNNTLPVTTGIRPDASLRQTVAKPRVQVTPENQAEVVSTNVSDRHSRRPPLFVQPMMDVRLSRTSGEAMRTYREVAMSGDQAELVNRVNVIA